MTKEKWQHWLQIGANTGLLIGLVFVAFQLYQDRQLKTAELIAGSLQEHHARHVALMGDDPATALTKLGTGQELDSRDQFIAKAYFNARMANWSRNSILEHLGLLSETWSDRVILADDLWANEYGIQSIEDYLQASPTLSDGLRTNLSDELQRVQLVSNARTSPTDTN